MVYEAPPEVNSGIMYTGPGSGSLVASAAAWQALAAELGSSGAAFGAVLSSLAAGAWLGPSSLTMAASAAPYVVWMIATAAQCEEAAASAAEAAAAFEAARAGVIPPPMIEANRAMLMTLVSTNFLGVNMPAIAANEATYDEFWAQDTSVMYTWAGDAAAASGMVTPFMPPPPTTNPAGMASQAMAVGESSAQAAGQQSVQQAVRMVDATGEIAGVPAGMDAQSMLTMAPQMISMVPQALQGFSSPLSSMTSGGGLGQFQSVLSPFMSMFANPGMLGGVSSGAATPSLAGLGGLGSAGTGVEALAGRAASLGGLSVPATWTASAAQAETATLAAATPVGASAGAAAAGSAVPAFCACVHR